VSYSIFQQREQPTFSTGGIKPFQCIGEGWALIKSQYGLFLGMCFVVILLVSCIPFAGLIWGAWMAGIYVALFSRMRGEPVSFNAISKGFEYFKPSFLVAFLSGLPFSLVGIGAKLLELHSETIEKTYPGETPVPPDVLMWQVGYLLGLILLYALCFFVTGVIFAFAYQLVVDQKLSGWEATKLSARAARENFGGVFGLVVLDLVLGMLGLALCCLGFVFVIPITKGAWAVAYSHVFPLAPQLNNRPTMPPPPPLFGAGPTGPVGY